MGRNRRRSEDENDSYRVDVMTDVIVVPDTHVAPGEDNSRARLLGKLIKERKPTHVVHIGDLADMGSMNFYDPIKSCSWLDDVTAVKDFMDKLRNSAGKAWTNATTVFCEGNHEERMRRKVAEMPELQGVIGLRPMGIFDWFDEVVEWEGSPGGPGIYELEGVVFAHYLQSKGGRAISGVNHARTMVKDWHQSCVVGHSHLLNYTSDPVPKGGHIHGIVCGCFFDHDHSWAGQTQRRYWRGVLHLHNVKDGQMDVEQISLHRLERMFS